MLVIIIALGNRALPAPPPPPPPPLPPSVPPRPSPVRGSKRPFDRVHMAFRPQTSSLDLWIRWFIHSLNRGPVGRFRLLFLGFHEGDLKKERPRLSASTNPRSRGLGGSLLVFDEIPAHRRWDPLFYWPRIADSGGRPFSLLLEFY